jgi:DNA polymerase-1
MLDDDESAPEPVPRGEIALIDLNGLVHRAFHGHAAGAGKLALRWVARALRALRPTHAAACVDLPFPTFRHRLLPDAYKAKGRATGEERAAVQRELRICEELCDDVLGVRVVFAEGFEGDDVIATLAGLAGCHGVSSAIVGRDKDLCQLVDRAGWVRMVDFQDGTATGWDDVIAKYGVRPDQFRDYQALVGDSTDGYPGCPGIGPKAALELLNAFGALDQIARRVDGLVCTPNVRKPLRKKLIDGYDLLATSRALATLRADVPLDLEFEDLRLCEGALETAERLGRRVEGAP